METDFYSVSNTTFNKWYEHIKNTSNNLFVIKTFCEYYSDSEDCSKIISIVDTTFKEIDFLYAIFIDIKYSRSCSIYTVEHEK